jgi:hypothetical protein
VWLFVRRADHDLGTIRGRKELVETTWFRQAALYRRHRLPVLTVLVLLRREANSPSFTGTFEIRMWDGWQTNEYNYFE